MRRHLRRKYISLDVCFRFKRYDISSEDKDPIIDNGWSYFVEDLAYKEQLKKYKGQKAVRLMMSSTSASTAYLTFLTRCRLV